MSEMAMTRARFSRLPYHHRDPRSALIDAAQALVDEEQGWTFSLREVARRVGVIHNAPYNHVPEKRDLLDAVAAVGFTRLRDGLASSIAGAETAEAMLAASRQVYVRLGTENPALYRLMFGPTLARSYGGAPPRLTRASAVAAKSAFEDMIVRGARSGAFAISPESRHDIALTNLSSWPAAHGLTMLIIDRVAGCEFSTDDMVERLIAIQLEGLRSVPLSRRRRSPKPPDNPQRS
jgi:AcrR family transcriptional regulator